MPTSIRSDIKLSYCPGCGHQLATNSLTSALDKMGLDPGDVIIVSDIGCCGLIDPLVNSHTIHGLHGRSTALAMGVSLGLNSADKKVIAIQGDGGATIGFQHLLEASRLNINLTLIVHNNMVYGMTGGQISGLSTSELKEVKMPEESSVPHYNICDLAHRTGASYCTRIIARTDFSDKLVEAVSTKGFSLVEILGTCPSYGFKKVRELENLPFKEETLINAREPYNIHIKKTHSLFNNLTRIRKKYSSDLQATKQIVIAGSAGSGVQLAANILTLAGMTAGLNATKKGEYPITVGTGFSVAEVILSRKEINYSGIESPDVIAIISEDGLRKVKDKINDKTILVLDKKLGIPAGKNVITGNFQKISGKKGAALTAIAYWLLQSSLFSLEAFIDAAKIIKNAEKLLVAIKNAELINKEIEN